VGVIPASVRCRQVDWIAFQLISRNEIPNALIFGGVAVGIKGQGDLPSCATCQLCGVLNVSGDCWEGGAVGSNKAPLAAG
jgi:hypothetical protein